MNFSGGKDSTAMLFLLLEHNYPIDYIVFCETGVEYPEIYEHVCLVNSILKKDYGKEITFLRNSLSFVDYMTIYKRKCGKYKGFPYSFPSPKNRWCTGMLRLQPLRKFKLDLKRKYPDAVFVDYIGYSTEEQSRCSYVFSKINENQKFLFPLIDFGFSGKDCLLFCYSLGFDWNSLYTKIQRASCYMCPFQRKREFLYLIHERYDLWKKIKQLETNLRKLGLSC